MPQGRHKWSWWEAVKRLHWSSSRPLQRSVTITGCSLRTWYQRCWIPFWETMHETFLMPGDTQLSLLFSVLLLVLQGDCIPLHEIIVGGIKPMPSIDANVTLYFANLYRTDPQGIYWALSAMQLRSSQKLFMCAIFFLSLEINAIAASFGTFVSSGGRQSSSSLNAYLFSISLLWQMDPQETLGTLLLGNLSCHISYSIQTPPAHISICRSIFYQFVLCIDI